MSVFIFSVEYSIFLEKSFAVVAALIRSWLSLRKIIDAVVRARLNARRILSRG